MLCKENITQVTNLFGKANESADEVLEGEDILLLFVTNVDITGTTAQVDKRLVVVRCGGVLRILIEAQLTFIQHTVQVHPRSAVVCGRESRRFDHHNPDDTMHRPATHLLRLG